MILIELPTGATAISSNDRNDDIVAGLLKQHGSAIRVVRPASHEDQLAMDRARVHRGEVGSPPEFHEIRLVPGTTTIECLSLDGATVEATWAGELIYPPPEAGGLPPADTTP